MTVRQLIRRFTQLHENERWIARAAHPLGQVAILVLATALLPAGLRLRFAPFLALALLAPARRQAILSVAALVVLYRLVQRAGVGMPATLVVGAATLLGLYLVYSSARAIDRLPPAIRRRPQLSLHVLVWLVLAGAALLASAPSALALEVAVGVAVVAPFVVWRCGYLVLAGQRGTTAGTRFHDHLFYMLPIFGGGSVPYGKGHDQLQRDRATDARARAGAQLAGLKLLMLAWAWKAVRRGLELALHGDDLLGLPTLRDSVTSPAPSVAIGWAVLFAELFVRVLRLASQGHVVIGCLRLLGYRSFRNTYKPLLATSVFQFWARFHYYFKELLVEFFFLPTYVTMPAGRPRLRLVAAVFAAAFAGNIYYHALRDVAGPATVATGSIGILPGARAIYCALLATGIAISLVRERARRGERPGPLVTIRRIAAVWLFYATIRIWSVPADVTLLERCRFFLSLFGA